MSEVTPAADASPEVAVSECSECKLYDDHTWWCGVGADEIQAGSRRYFWRD